MRKYIFILFLLLFSSIAFAEPTLFYKQGESIDLKIPCANDGLPCSSVSTCNITINYPNGSNMVNNQLMTNNGAYHNYTLVSSSVVGEYQTTIFCEDGADAGYDGFSFQVNSTGEKENENTILIIYLVLLGISFAYLFIGFKLDDVHIVSKILSYFFGMISLIVMLLMIYLESISVFVTHTMLLYLLEGNLLILFILISYHMIYVLKKTKQMKMGDNDWKV